MFLYCWVGVSRVSLFSLESDDSGQLVVWIVSFYSNSTTVDVVEAHATATKLVWELHRAVLLAIDEIGGKTFWPQRSLSTKLFEFLADEDLLGRNHLIPTLSSSFARRTAQV